MRDITVTSSLSRTVRQTKRFAPFAILLLLLLLSIPWTSIHAVPIAQTGGQDAPAGTLPLTNVGDINGDGHDDFMRGIPFGGENREGTFVLYLGGPDGPADEYTRFVTSGHAGAMMGYAIRGVGDLNGDGYNDVAVGAPTYDGTSGAVYIIGGSAEADLPLLLKLTGAEDDFAGLGILPLGDFDQDGLADFGIVYQAGLSSREAYLEQDGIRQIYVVYGGLENEFRSGKADYNDLWAAIQSDAELGSQPTQTEPEPTESEEPPSWHPGRIATLRGAPFELFGQNSVIVGDVNGDGFDDLAINSLGNERDVTPSRVILFYGAETGINHAPDWTASSEIWSQFYTFWLCRDHESPLAFSQVIASWIHGLLNRH